MGTQCLRVKLGHPVPRVIHMVPGSLGWGLGMGLTNPPRKNCLLGKQNCDLGPILGEWYKL